jgi:FtsZ-interacting cell division protein ZipA
MPELRWTLLILGVVFIAALAWWEFRRPRQSSHASPERLTPTLDTPSESATPGHAHREPTLNLPEMRAREQPQEIPIVEVAEDSLIGLRMDGARPEAQAPAPEPDSEEPILPEPGEEDQTAKLVVERPAVPLPQAPVVEWPAEDVRKIIALRLVSVTERFQGRALRQALAAEGFMFGRFSIFHKAGDDGRAIVSAASLSKPGTFTPESMDTQRFGGLNLFAILPGPLDPGEAFEELLVTARSLNDRLQGGLQTDRGKPLTPSEVTAIRDVLNPPPPPPEEAPP